ncbi:ETX/MTX2 family pore-forming toxin [Peribacillus simplex]|uniref:ETX/MTX2 family pore-forming toxin n=1 Tax=Peribacillus simplex TaxID=1478 RepID=UPI003D2B976E
MKSVWEYFLIRLNFSVSDEMNLFSQELQNYLYPSSLQYFAKEVVFIQNKTFSAIFYIFRLNFTFFLIFIKKKCYHGSVNKNKLLGSGFEMKKKIILGGVVASTLLVGTFSSNPSAILGAEPANVKAAEHSKSSAYQNLDDRVRKMLESATWGGMEYRNHNIKDAELNGSNIESSMIQNSQLLTVGENILENTLGHEITLPTSGYEHEFTEKTSTTNTTGWTFGYNYNASLSVMMVSASHSFSVDYNMSTSNTTEKTQTRKFIVPSQQIPVPAGKTYKVEYTFEKITVSGKNNLNANLYGDVTYYFNNQPMSPSLLYSQLNFASDKQGFERVIRDTVEGNDRFGIKATGIGQFSTEFGTRLYAKITDITDSRNPVTVETKAMPVKFETISVDTKVVE